MKSNEFNNRNIWLYWENKEGDCKPPYLDLCLETIINNAGQFNSVKVLNDKTLPEYIELPPRANKIKEIAHKTDIIRTRLLNKYGGLWLDSDVIILKDLSFILKLLDENDFVGFGHAKNKPRLPFFACNKGSLLMSKWIERQDEILNKKVRFKWTEIGTSIIWNLNKSCYDRYYQLPYRSVAPITFKESKILFQDKDPCNFINKDTIACLLFNHFFPRNLKKNSKDEIINSKFLFSRIIKMALDR